ncbi:hypothetical protein JOB18_014931 [Solea senegalensis]|uniref:Uncharacterized protein n=1 Tax=Solea senegalensis TaxID=28829 RepID=A0AAV6RN84_SOLSE|nr:hypothetical protein JOB18_014931 [Solea senegalensis]
MQACCQPRLTLRVQNGADLGNLTEGVRDRRHPGTAGWQVRGNRWFESTLIGRWPGLKRGPEDSQTELVVHDVLDSAAQSQRSPTSMPACKDTTRRCNL